LRIIIIVAVARNSVIGRKNGEMPWHVKEEFQHFKNTTLGYPMIMGRKTFETLGKPLKGRENIIVSRNDNLSYEFDEIKIFHSLQESFDYLKKKNEEKVFIIGGGEIYRQAIGFADELLISFMKFDAEGEVCFPEISNEIWKEETREEREQFKIIKYIRIR
jgi:dihydrofolate reductase